MDERLRRQWAASEARDLGWGGITTVAQATGICRTTITAGLGELALPEAERMAEASRVRRPGGGRKSLTETDPGLRAALEALIDPRRVAIRNRRCVGHAVGGGETGDQFRGTRGPNVRELMAADEGQAGRRLHKCVAARNRGDYAGQKEARRRWRFKIAPERSRWLHAGTWPSGAATPLVLIQHDYYQPGRQAPCRCRPRICLLKGCERWFSPLRSSRATVARHVARRPRRWSRWQAAQRYRASEKGKECRRQQAFRYRERVRQRRQAARARDGLRGPSARDRCGKNSLFSSRLLRTLPAAAPLAAEEVLLRLVSQCFTSCSSA